MAATKDDYKRAVPDAEEWLVGHAAREGMTISDFCRTYRDVVVARQLKNDGRTAAMSHFGDVAAAIGK